MVVLVIDLISVLLDERKRDSPVPAYLDRPCSGSVPLKRMQIQAGQIHISWRRRNV
jgi:hypothetical protein